MTTRRILHTLKKYSANNKWAPWAILALLHQVSEVKVEKVHTGFRRVERTRIFKLARWLQMHLYRSTKKLLVRVELQTHNHSHSLQSIRYRSRTGFDPVVFWLQRSDYFWLFQSLFVSWAFIFTDRWLVTRFHLSATSGLGWCVCCQLDSERVSRNGRSLGLRNQPKSWSAGFCTYSSVSGLFAVAVRFIMVGTLHVHNLGMQLRVCRRIWTIREIREWTVSNDIPDSSSTLPDSFIADQLGQGSTQATEDPSSTGNDQPFWDALNAHVKNLHAIISGHGKYLAFSFCPSLLQVPMTMYYADHGNEWCAREPSKDVVFCFDKHSGYARSLWLATLISWTFVLPLQIRRLRQPRMGPWRTEYCIFIRRSSRWARGMDQARRRPD